MSGQRIAIGSRAFVILTTTLLLTLLPQSCFGEGVFELRLASFENFDYSRDAMGQCCDGKSCAGSCRTYFRVCLQHYQADIDPNGVCTFGSKVTPIMGNDSLVVFPFNNNSDSTGMFENPMKFEFEFTWTGTFSLIIEAWNSKNDDSTSPGPNASLIYRLATPRWLDVGPNWTEQVNKTEKVSIKYAFRVLCQPNYFGKGCAKLCRPRDDKFGHYTCSAEGKTECLPGWSGEYCTKVICAPGCHQQHGTCNKPNECICRTGWQGHRCDECIRYPGCQHGTCNQPWQCTCDEGWGGLFCNQDLNYCTNHKPCKNGGTCTNTGQGSYTCACPDGFSGTNCEVRQDPCATHLPICNNFGTCVSSGSNVSCICLPGYSGSLCETKILSSACLSSPCANGGTCIPAPYQEGQDEKFSCICPDEFEGDACQRQKDVCKPTPCQNGGRCVGHSDNLSFSCDCPTGFHGHQCEVNVDDCAGQPCVNGGTCVDEVNGFRCHCVPGFTGDSCEQTVDYCLLKPCANGGTCHDLLNDFRCTCQPGFTGKDCSLNIDECRSSPCLNAGTCQDRVNEFTCVCRPGFGGDRCELGPGMSGAWPIPKMVTIVTNDLERRVPTGSVDSDTRDENLELSRYTGDAGKVIESREEGRLSPEQVALVATLSAAVPLLALIAVTIILIVRHRKRRERERHEAEVTRQNKLNSMNNSKCFGGDKSQQIVNPLDTDKSSSLASTTNQGQRRTLKVTNDTGGGGGSRLLSDPIGVHNQNRKSNSSSYKIDSASMAPVVVGANLSVGTLQRTSNNKRTNLDAVNRCPSLTSVVLKDDSSANIASVGDANNVTLQRTNIDRKDVSSSNQLPHNNPQAISEPIYRSETPREVCPHGIYVIEDHYTSQYGEDVLATEV